MRGILGVVALGAALVAAACAPAVGRADDLPPEAYIFYDAAASGDTATVRSMLRDHPTFATLKYRYDVTALHAAALADEPLTVDLIVRRGAYVDARGGQQKVTPLFLATLKGHARTAAALLDRRADPNAKGDIPGDDGGHDLRPLHVAALEGHAAIAEALLRHGAVLAPRSQEGETPADCARRNSRMAVRSLLAIYARDGLVRGGPLATLVLAIDARDSVAAERALARNAKLVRDTLADGWTPLHLAAAGGDRGVCDVLLAHGANPAAQEALTHWTPALRAYDSGFAALCEYLRKKEPVPGR